MPTRHDEVHRSDNNDGAIPEEGLNVRDDVVCVSLPRSAARRGELGRLCLEAECGSVLALNKHTSNREPAGCGLAGWVRVRGWVPGCHETALQLVLRKRRAAASRQIAATAPASDETEQTPSCVFKTSSRRCRWTTLSQEAHPATKSRRQSTQDTQDGSP
jgi:hypothetical protein